MKIITIGSATRDCIIQTDRFEVLEKGLVKGEAGCLPLGAKIELEDIHFTIGGGGTNSAYTFARQGFDVSCFCKIGKDLSGEEVLEVLEKEDIDTSLVEKSSLSTAFSVILLSEEGRTILVYRGASKDFGVEDFNEEELKADWFYITSLGGRIDFLEKVVEYASDNIKVALNPGLKELERGERLISILDKVDLLLLNKKEASLLSKKETPKQALKELSDSKVVVITKGKKGVEVSAAGKIFQAGIFEEREFVDPTGAGDAFGSGFASGFIHGGGDYKKEGCIKSAIRLGAANAASIVGHLGAKRQILTRDEFEGKERWNSLKINVKSF